MAKYQDWITEEGLLKLEGWARDGLTDEQIADKMGISTSSLYNYKKKHLEILEALKKGKEVVDRQVENALLKRAMGYTYEEETKELIKQPNGKMKMTTVKTVIKQVPPDTTAQIFWLKNRKPAEWRDKQVTEIEGSITTNQNPLKNLTEAELRKLAQTD